MNATKKALTELKDLAKQAGTNIYRRLELAVQVLDDLDWIAAEHGGSDLKAQDAVETEFFPDLHGYVSLGKLIAMFRRVSRAQWAEVRFDIAAVEVLYDAQGDEDERAAAKRTAWKVVAEERGEKLAEIEHALATVQADATKASTEVERLRGRIEQLSEELRDLREENARLRVELKRAETSVPAMA